MSRRTEPPRPERASTINDVARLAGVSTATVSRTLRQPGKVSHATRDRVMEAIGQTRFVPNAQARNFRSQRSNSVILLVRDISNPFYLEIFKGVEQAAGEAGFNVLMGDARNEAGRVPHFLDMVRTRQADGLILMVGSLPESVRRDRDLPPTVILSETFPELSLPTVRIDNAAAAQEAVRYLVSQGHRAIACLAGPRGERLAIEREAGYRQALEAAGIGFDPALVLNGDYSIEAGHRAIADLCARGTGFSAVFATSDLMAIGVINELRNRGRSVPADVSVIGFDDIVLALASYPPLTTVQQPREAMGRAAMQLMVDLIQGAPMPKHDLVLDAHLVIRGTVGPCVAPA